MQITIIVLSFLFAIVLFLWLSECNRSVYLYRRLCDKTDEKLIFVNAFNLLEKAYNKHVDKFSLCENCMCLTVEDILDKIDNDFKNLKQTRGLHGK